MSRQIRDILIPGFSGPLTYNDYIAGGIFIRATRTQRNNITYLLRTLNALETTICYVEAENAWYKLSTNPSSESTSDSDWTLMDFGATQSLVPIGVWDPTTNTPDLTDAGAIGINGSFYFVTNAFIGYAFTDPDLFGGATITVYNGDLVISVGTSWVVIRPTTTWDSISHPSVIDDYVAGTVIAHTHIIDDVTGLQTALDSKYDSGDVADSSELFVDVPNDDLVDVEFLRTHYFTSEQVTNLVDTISGDLDAMEFTFLVDTPNSYSGQAGKAVAVNGTSDGLVFIDFPASGVTSVSGTAGRIDSSGGSTPIINISASYIGQSSITTLGTISTGIWSGTAIGVTKGGTGLTTITAGKLLYGSAADTISALAAPGGTGKVLQSTSSTAFGWSSVLWPTTLATGDILYASSATTLSRLATAGVANQILTTNGGSFTPSWGALQNGNGTTANGLKFDLGGDITTDIQLIFNNPGTLTQFTLAASNGSGLFLIESADQTKGGLEFLSLWGSEEVALVVDAGNVIGDGFALGVADDRAVKKGLEWYSVAGGGITDFSGMTAFTLVPKGFTQATYAPISGGNYWPITGSKTLTGSVTVTLTNTTNISSVISSRGSKAVFTVGNGAIQNSNGYISLAVTGLTASRGYTLSLDPNNETGLGSNLTFTNIGSTVSTIVYAADYSASYTSRSLVDQGYVLGAKTFTGIQTFSLTSVYTTGTGIDSAGILNVGGTNATTVNLGTGSGNTNINIGTSGTNTIQIGNSNSTVNILGTVLYENVTNLQVTDKLITLNKGGSGSSATGSGIELEESSSITGYFKTTGGRDGWLLKAPSISNDISFLFTNISSARSYTLPNASGTIAISASGNIALNATTGDITFTGTLPVGNGGTGTATTFTQGSVLFSGAAGVYSQDNANFFWDATNHWLGLGNVVPLAKLHIAETLTTTNRGALIDQYSTGVNGSRISLRKARGTFSSPVVIVTGDTLASWTAEGYDGTNFLESAKILVTSTGTITTGAIGSIMTLQTMTTGGVLTTAITISAAQVVTLANALPVASGGTNITSYAVGDLIYASGATTLSKLVDIATGSALITGGVGVAPSYGKITSSHVDATVLTSTTGWLVTGTTTMTGAVTLASPSSSTPKPFQFTGTWTGTAASDYHVRVAGTITGDATTSRIFNNVLYDPSLTAGANSQILTNLTLNATYNTNSKTSIQQVALRALSGIVAVGNNAVDGTFPGAAIQTNGLIEINSSSGNACLTIRNGATCAAWVLTSGTVLDLRISGAPATDVYAVGITTGNHGWFQISQSATHNFLSYTQAVHTGGSPVGFLFTQGAHTSLATTAEATTVNWNLSSTVQWASGTVALQRFGRVQVGTVSFVGSSTMTRAVGWAISGPPKAGTNAALTTSIGLEIEARDVSGGNGVTTAYGVVFNAPTGATNNYVGAAVGGKFMFAATVAGYASINTPHGTAPSSPVDGDWWTTSTAAYVRINGSTVTLGSGGITNTGAANEIVKSDGTNVVPTGLYSTAAGNLRIGVTSLSGSRTISTASSDADCHLTMNLQAAGEFILKNGSDNGWFNTQNLRFDLFFATANANPLEMNFHKGRGGTGGETIIINGDTIYRIASRGFISTSTASTDTSRIEAVVNGTVTTGPTSIPTDLVFSLGDGSGTPTERLRLRSDGKLLNASDYVVTDATKGLVLKDTQGTPHYWRVTVSTLGVLTVTDLGTSI